MTMVIDFQQLNKEYKRKDIITRKQIKQEVIRFALKQHQHDSMWFNVRKLMLNNNLNHVKLPKQNLEIWLKKGSLIFDILNEDAISVDDMCPFCGNHYFDWAKILYIHTGMSHERYVYACSCGRFYSIYFEKDE